MINLKNLCLCFCAILFSCSSNSIESLDESNDNETVIIIDATLPGPETTGPTDVSLLIESEGLTVDEN
jgi:hypothetical protein